MKCVITCICVAGASTFMSCSFGPEGVTPDREPQVWIEELRVEPEIVTPSHPIALLTCVIGDAEEWKAAEYEWSSEEVYDTFYADPLYELDYDQVWLSGGFLAPTGDYPGDPDKRIWMGPSDPGTYEVTVTVCSGNHAATLTRGIEVRDESGAILTAEPSYRFPRKFTYVIGDSAEFFAVLHPSPSFFHPQLYQVQAQFMFREYVSEEFQAYGSHTNFIDAFSSQLILHFSRPGVYYLRMQAIHVGHDTAAAECVVPIFVLKDYNKS